MSEQTKQWYVLRAIGGKEKKVKEYIDAEVRHLNLEHLVSQVLIPTEKVYTIRNGKKVSKERVSYPGYVLVEAAMVDEVPYVLRNTPNVLGFLGETKEESQRLIATPVREAEVARILGRVDQMSAGEEENEIPFFVGETVKVTDGPFSSFAKNVKRIFPDAVLIMLIPPTFSIQEERLRGRATETEEVILARLEKAKREIEQLDAYDYIVYNYNGGSAVAADDIKAIVRAEKLARHRQPDAAKKYFEN